MLQGLHRGMGSRGRGCCRLCTRPRDCPLKRRFHGGMQTAHHVTLASSGAQRSPGQLYIDRYKNNRLRRTVKGFILSTTMDTMLAPPKPRGRPREFDRDEALECAMRLFWSRGYEATSISDLTKAMHITPPALYAAFGDKKRLFLEAVGRYEQGHGCFVQKALLEEPTVERAMRRLLLGALKSFTNPKNPRGCLVVLGATNCTLEATDISKALADRRRMAVSAVRARIAAGKNAGELSDHADVDALTDMVTATLYGLAIKARDGISRARLQGIVEQLMKMWPRQKVKKTDADRGRRIKSRRHISTLRRARAT
jgi:TetR/AcrR family transcriptional regulator, copper-responsive repressor